MIWMTTYNTLKRDIFPHLGPCIPKGVEHLRPKDFKFEVPHDDIPKWDSHPLFSFSNYRSFNVVPSQGISRLITQDNIIDLFRGKSYPMSFNIFQTKTPKPSR